MLISQLTLNVVGLPVCQIHEFTESLYDDLFEKYDAVAELIKMKGEKPLVRMADYIREGVH